MVSIGLVLGGGAALGAYHIGVYQVIKELGLEEYITSIAGSSVGALNAVNIVHHGGFEQLYGFWSNIHCRDVLDKGGYLLCEFEKVRDQDELFVPVNRLSGIGNLPTDPEIGVLFTRNGNRNHNSDEYDGDEYFSGGAKSYSDKSYNQYKIDLLEEREKSILNGLPKQESDAVHNGFESAYIDAQKVGKPTCTNLVLSTNTQLSNTLSQYYNILSQNLEKNSIPVYISMVNADAGKLQFITQTNKSNNKDILTFKNVQDIIDGIMASASASPLYPCYNLKGTLYRDGGQIDGDNLPYKVLEQEEDPDFIINVSVSPKDQLPVGEKYINIKLDPKLAPIRHLISFNSSFARDLIQRGVKDARAILKKAFDISDNIDISDNNEGTTSNVHNIG